MNQKNERLGSVVSKRWRYIKFPSPWEGRKYHPERRLIFPDLSMAKAKSQLPDSYYDLLFRVNCVIHEKDILRRKE